MYSTLLVIWLAQALVGFYQVYFQVLKFFFNLFYRLARVHTWNYAYKISYFRLRFFISSITALCLSNVRKYRRKKIND